MIGNASQLKKEYENNYKEQRIKNLKHLRENIAKMNQTDFSNELGIQKSNFSLIENGGRDLSLYNIQAYKTYFKEQFALDISTDFLLGYTDILTNEIAGICDITGLSGKSLETLKIWNYYKCHNINVLPMYGRGDIEGLNLILEDWYNRYTKRLPALIGQSILSDIRAYIYSDLYEIEKPIGIRYKSGNKWYALDVGDIVKNNKNERDIEQIQIIGELGSNLSTNNEVVTKLYNKDDRSDCFTSDLAVRYEAVIKDNINHKLDSLKRNLSPLEMN